MKKLMIAAAIVCAAVYANAANCKWGFSSDAIEAAPGSSLAVDGYIDGGTALLYLGTIAIGADGALTGLDGATFLASSGQNADYRFGSTATKVDLAGLASDAGGQNYTLILLDANGYDYSKLNEYVGQAIIYNGKSTQGVNPMDDTDHWAIMTDSTAYGSGDWQTVAAPEPTSGLLLLLGMAGLALKRKRA